MNERNKVASKTMTRTANRELTNVKDPTNDQRSSRAKNVALWTLQILTAAALLLAGFGALSGQPMMVATFDKIGIGQWFRYVTGCIELTSAILLLIPRLTPVGAALLLCTMIGAVLSHLLMIGGSPVPALVLLCLAAIILWGRFETVKAWLGKLPALGVRNAKPENAVTNSFQTR
jgi:putative oxidoreductase